MKKILVNKEMFKKVKRHKKVFYIDSEFNLKNIEEKEIILIKNLDNNKEIKRKVKKVTKYETKEDLINALGEKYTSGLELKDIPLISIEFRRNKKIIIKSLLACLLILIVVLGVYTCKNYFVNLKSESLKEEIKEFDKEINYVIVEINPKIALEIINDKVKSKACLNEDCVNLFSDINIENYTLENAVKTLYDKSKELNLNVSNGVKISSSKDIDENTKNLNYVEYKKITSKEETKEVKQAIDNKTIKNKEQEKNLNNLKHNSYKKHSYYNKYFTCDYKNNEFGCYLEESFIKNLIVAPESYNEVYDWLKSLGKLEAILKLFNIEYETVGIEGINFKAVDRIVLNGVSYGLFESYSYGISSITTQGTSESYVATYNRLSINLGTILDENENFKSARLLPLEKLNLVNQTYNELDVNVLSIESDKLILNGSFLPNGYGQ